MNCSDLLPLVCKANVHRRFSCIRGAFVVSEDIVGFWAKSITFGSDVNYRIPIDIVQSAKVHKPSGPIGEHTLVLEIRGQHNLRFTFRNESQRDEAIAKIRAAIEHYEEKATVVASPTTLSPAPSPPPQSAGEDSRPSSAAPSSDSDSRDPLALRALSDSAVQREESVDTKVTGSRTSGSRTTRSTTSILAPISRIPAVKGKSPMPFALRAFFPKAINVPENAGLMRMSPKHFVCLTIGSRGDVQPYIALGLGLQKEGHKVTIVTHEEYKEWVTGFGIEHRTAGGDPGALMKLSVENKVRARNTTGCFEF